MAYTPIGWLNDQAPAINQTNLNKMDNGIVDLHKKPEGFQIVADGVGLSGKVFLNGHWIHGTIYSSGNIGTSGYDNQVISDVMLKYDTDVTIKAEAGYKFDIFFYNSDVIGSASFTSAVYSKTSYTVSAGQYFDIKMIKSGESGVISIPETVRKFYLDGYINTVTSDIAKIESDILDINNDLDIVQASIQDGKAYLDGHWVNGNIYNSGAITTEGYKYQVLSDKMLYVKNSITLLIAQGYKIVVAFYSSEDMDANHFISKTSYITAGSYVISANTYFTVLILKDPSSSSQVLDPSVEYKGVYYDASITDAIEKTTMIPNMDVALKTGKYYLPGNWVHGNISTGGNVSYSDTYITQVISDKMIYTDVPMKLTIQDGYKITFVKYSGNIVSSVDFVSYTENITAHYDVSANTYFTIIVKKSGQTTEMDINTAAHVVYSELPLTQRMVDEISNMLSTDFLPGYWQTQIEQDITKITANDAVIGNNGDSFVFITDVHLFRNSKNSPALIKYILAHSEVDKVFFGGDLIEKDTGDTGKADAIAEYSVWNNLMYGTDYFFIVGNHDGNNYDGTNASNELTQAEIYGLTIKRIEKFYDTNRSTSYCIDNLSQKTRYICIDCEKNADLDSVYEWMQGKMTELESGWNLVIMQHRYWGSNTSTVSIQGQKLQEAINEVYESLNCTLICVIVGHTHTDYKINDETYGYPIIAVNCDTRDGSVSGYTRTVGTISEQSFDVVHIDYTNQKIYMTRIGAGSDREFSY